MMEIKKRLKKLEEEGRRVMAADVDKNAIFRIEVSRAMEPLTARLFDFWRERRLALGLPAERQDYEDEKASEAAAWEKHFATLPVEEREKLEKSPLNKAIAGMLWLRRGSR